MKYKQLGRSFFWRDTHIVAKALLGKLLVRHWRSQTLVGRITEVEAYVGQDDLACHASHGLTPRTAVMFGPPGRAYVYLIYGLHYCLNIVTEKSGVPAAVLIRSLNTSPGPGRLTRALHITHTLNQEDLTTSKRLLVVDDGLKVKPPDIETAPRIGVDYAGAAALLPWRYYIKM